MLTVQLVSVASARGLRSGKSEVNFAPDQPWVKTPAKLKFVDETEGVICIYDQNLDSDEEDTPAEDAANAAASPPEAGPQAKPDTVAAAPLLRTYSTTESPNDLRSVTSRSPKRRRMTGSGTTSNSISNLSLAQEPSFHSPVGSIPHQSPSDPYQYLFVATPTEIVQPIHHVSPTLHSHAITPEQPIDSVGREADYYTPSLSAFNLSPHVWPLQEEEEAQLLRYFITELSASFDLCDPYKHFGLVAPQRAAECPTLLNAIFAASAKHLSRVSNYSPLIADRYHDRCIKHLIPMLDDDAAVFDENLMAATVILRYLEEIEGKSFLAHPSGNLPNSDLSFL